MSQSNYVDINIGPYPFEVYYCPTEKAFQKVMKEKGIKNEPYPTSSGHVLYFSNHSDYDPFCTITFNPRKGISDAQMVGLVAHEATHVVDFLFESIGEQKPALEQRAYTVQNIVQAIWKEGIKRP